MFYAKQRLKTGAIAGFFAAMMFAESTSAASLTVKHFSGESKENDKEINFGLVLENIDPAHRAFPIVDVKQWFREQQSLQVDLESDRKPSTEIDDVGSCIGKSLGFLNHCTFFQNIIIKGISTAPNAPKRHLWRIANAIALRVTDELTKEPIFTLAQVEGINEGKLHSVPEPLTLLGSVTALAIGLLLKRKYDKRKYDKRKPKA